jgi:hypothetical protein
MILYHTTSFAAADDIKTGGQVKPKDYDSFVSFSEEPFRGDISANEVTLKVEVDPSLVEKVEYTKNWYRKHTDQAAYIAGEGWREQFTYPEDIYDEEGEADPDAEEQAYDEAQLESFLYKSGENEWISLTQGPVPVQVLDEIAVVARIGKVLQTIAQLFADPRDPYDRLFGQPAIWETPLAEYMEKVKHLYEEEYIRDKHQEAVLKALYRGDAVPPEVLKDYPDLGTKDYDEPTPIATKLTDLDVLQRPNHVYRGMAKAEYDGTVGAGNGVQSDRRWCFSNEGTCFATDPSSSGYYVFDSRTSPKVTGEPVYIVEVTADETLMHKDRDGYVKTKDPEGWIPQESVTRAWEITYNPDDDFYYIQQVYP